MMMVSQAVGDFLVGDLGVSPAAADRVMQLSAAYPESGVQGRLAQLRFGVSKSILSTDEAASLATEQPWFFECAFGTAYEDEHIVAASKPWDALLSSDASGPRWEGELSLRDWLKENHPSTTTEDGDEVRLCHNLDFATSGVIVAAKSRAAADAVSRTFREREARKLYAALVVGHPSWDTARWDERIMPSKRRFKQRISKGGKSASTIAHVGARGTLRVGEHKGQDASLLWLEPQTGRRHQLRVHCAHHGHGIVGDLSYADDRLMYRMFLHAAALEMPLQLDGDEAPPRKVRCQAPLGEGGWAHVFDAQEPLRLPEEWADAETVLLS